MSEEMERVFKDLNESSQAVMLMIAKRNGTCSKEWKERRVKNGRICWKFIKWKRGRVRIF